MAVTCKSSGTEKAEGVAGKDAAECQAVCAERCGWIFSSAINSEMVPKAIQRVANGFLSASNEGYFLIATKHHHHFKLSFLCQN